MLQLGPQVFLLLYNMFCHVLPISKMLHSRPWHRVDSSPPHTYFKGGTKCLPLAAMASCNNHPCPVDCQLHAWGGWSKCSAKCGGGVTQRLRDVKRAMMYDGKPCGQSSMTKACNAEACEKDCELSEWTKWTSCSKNCDGGSQIINYIIN